jgi:MFS family permease
MLSNSAYAIIAPFVPFEAQKKHVDQTWIGYVFSVYSVAFIICSPFFSQLIKSQGRQKLISIGMLSMGLSFIAFGLLSFIESRETFIAGMLIARFMQGFSSSLI